MKHPRLIKSVIRRQIHTDSNYTWETVLELEDGRKYYWWECSDRWSNESGRILSYGYGAKLTAAVRRHYNKQS